MWPLGRRADRTHTLFRAHSSQLGSANRYRWLAPADFRCEDMPNTTPLPPASALAPRLTGPLTGVPRWETPQPPLTHTRHHTHASHAMLSMPDVAVPRTPHSAHTQVPAAAYRRPGYEQVQLYTAVPYCTEHPNPHTRHAVRPHSTTCKEFGPACRAVQCRT